MKLTRRHKAYWRINLWLTGSLLLVWFTVTFGSGFFAQTLNQYSFLGFPLAFYIFSQRALVVFLILIGCYVWAMNRLDRKFGVAERR